MLAMPEIALAAQGAGMAMSLLGNAQASAMNESIALANAELARRAEAEEIAAGVGQAGKVLARGSRIAAEAEAAASVSGTAVSGGSVQDVLSRTRLVSAIDAATVMDNAVMASRGRAQQARNFMAQAEMEKSQRLFGAAGTLLTGTAGMARSAYDMGIYPKGRRTVEEDVPYVG